MSTAAPAAAGDCFVPATAAVERALDSQRAVRYAALLQLIDEIQRRRTIAEVAQVVAARWKHCANITNWRLLCVHRGEVALIVAHGREAQVEERTLAALAAWDAEYWGRMLPSYDNGERLAALRAGLPDNLADARGSELAILPVQQADSPIALLSALSGDAVFDMLDRKFLGHVAGAMAGRINAIMTERALGAELIAAEHEIAEQRHVAILGRLVNGVAHELNTPLGVQISACDSLAVILRGGVPPDPRDLLDTVTLVGQQATRAAGIVRRLKQVSAVAQSTPRLPTPLLAAIESIAASCLARRGAPQIALSGDDEITLDLDRNALGILLTELIDNASVHAGRPEGPCELDLDLQQGADGAVWLDVRDNGPGMDDATAARFFQPFVTTRQSEGHMGLGGYIVRSLARDALQGAVHLIRTQGMAGICVRLEFARPAPVQ